MFLQQRLDGCQHVINTLIAAGHSMTSSERPSPEPLLKKEASPAVLRGRQLWKCSGSFVCLELQGLGDNFETLSAFRVCYSPQVILG